MPCCRYFLTAAGGLEDFALEEVGWRWAVADGATAQGKVFFATSSPIRPGAGTPARPLLCSAERLFVQVLRAAPLSAPPTGERADACAVAAAADVVRAVPAAEWRRCAELRRRLLGQEGHGGAAGGPLGFRLRVKVGGAAARAHGGPALAAAFGSAIAEHVGWRADDGDDAMQVYIQCSDQHVLLGLAAAGPALSERTDAPHPGLRSTVAWAAARLALGRPPALSPEPEESGVVLACDPFCGRGSLITEALRDWPQALCLLGDAALHTDATLRTEASANLRASTGSGAGSAGMACLDARALPIRTGSVDVFLTDPPFGKQHGDSATVRSLYPAMLAEMRRAVAAGGALVMLCPTRHWRFFCSLVLPLRDQSGEAGAAGAPHPASLAVWRAGTEECCCWRLEAARPITLGQVSVQLCRLAPDAIPRPNTPAAAAAPAGGSTNHACGVSVGGESFTRRSLLARCRTVTAAAQAALGAQEHTTLGDNDSAFLLALDRLRQEPTGASCVWFGVNRQAPHTQCFLFGSGAEGAAAARPVSLKRVVDELCGVPGSGRPKKRKRQPP